MRTIEAKHWARKFKFAEFRIALFGAKLQSQLISDPKSKVEKYLSFVYQQIHSTK